MVLLFHFEKVHKKTSYLKQAACLVYKNKVLLKISDGDIYLLKLYCCFGDAEYYP